MQFSQEIKHYCCTFFEFTFLGHYNGGTAATRPGKDAYDSNVCAGAQLGEVKDGGLWNKLIGTPTARTTFKAGEIIDLEWKVTGNHGGKYSWRLCPENTPKPSEDCFQKNVLKVVTARF